MLLHYSLLSLMVVLSSCAVAPSAHNQNLQDRIIACGAGLSDDAVINLQAAYVALNDAGQLSSEFENSARSVIFNELPAVDRLKAYEDYIQCIKQDWNQPAVGQHLK